MSIFKITLRDGTEYQLADGDVGSKFSIICPDKQTFYSVWESMTNENLSEVTVTIDGTAMTIMRYLILDGTQTVFSTTGTIMGLFYFHGAEYNPVTPEDQEDAEYVQAAKILLGEEV